MPDHAALPDRSVVPPVWGRITNLVVDHGEGSWLVTPAGERYLDYTSGIGVTNTGHAHPRVVAAGSVAYSEGSLAGLRGSPSPHGLYSSSPSPEWAAMRISLSNTNRPHETSARVSFASTAAG